jgi:hypothetical protein
MLNPTQSFLAIAITLCTCVGMAASQPGVRRVQGETIYTDYLGQEYTSNILYRTGDSLSRSPEPSIYVTRFISVANPTATTHAFVINYMEESAQPQADKVIANTLTSEARKFCVREGSSLVEESLIPTKDIQNAGNGNIESKLRTPYRSFFKKRRILEIMFNCQV